MQFYFGIVQGKNVLLLFVIDVDVSAAMFGTFV